MQWRFGSGLGLGRMKKLGLPLVEGGLRDWDDRVPIAR